MLKNLYNLYYKSLAFPKYSTFLDRLIIRLTNIILPKYFLFSGIIKKHELPKNRSKNEDFIVSLTTFPPRINKVWLTIETILRQKEKPDKILLWLYKDEFSEKASLPKNLLRLEKRGLEIRYCDENLMPHKKYFYSIQEYPNANIITIDDDMFYPSDLIGIIIRFHSTYPDSIICSITRKIEVLNGEIQPYRNWKYERKNSSPSHIYLTMGGGGTLFPKDSLHKCVLDLEVLKQKALQADDIWLKIMSLKNNTKVVSIADEFPRFFIPIIQKNKMQLMDSNIGLGQNDIIFKALLQHYQIPISIFEEKEDGEMRSSHLQKSLKY